MKRGSCVVNGREETQSRSHQWRGDEMKEFKMDYYVYLAPFVLYTVSLGAYRGAMKRSARHASAIRPRN